MKTNTGVRPSPIAGQWYSADPKKLASQIDRFVEAVNLPPLSGEVLGVMVPHAGHQYSGQVAAYGFSTLRGQEPELVVVASPMHYPYYEPLLVSAHTAYETPFGQIPIAHDVLQVLDNLLQDQYSLKLTYVTHDPEHSLEIELPFLQRILQKEFQLVPIMVRDSSKQVTHALGEALAEVLEHRSVTLVASTDLSHFFSQDVAEALDRAMLQQVESLDPQGVLDVEDEGKGFACGRGALAAVMWAVRSLGADCAKILRHATSGDVTGDYDRVVGYAAAVFLRTQREKEN
jgi:MEMO1 family protein